MQGKERDWERLLKDASEGYMIGNRQATWDAGRPGVVHAGDGKTEKKGGFMKYERLALPYRDATERIGDYKEVLVPLVGKERDELLNTQVRLPPVMFCHKQSKCIARLVIASCCCLWATNAASYSTRRCDCHSF